MVLTQDELVCAIVVVQQPRTYGASAKMEFPLRIDAGIARRPLVCVVDANPKHRHDAVRALASFYEVAEFSEQGSALEAIALIRPTAILLDENVHPRCGLALLREICCVPELDRIPIICTATRDRVTFLADASGLGVRTTLVKPFRRSVLLRALSNEMIRKVERSWVRIEPVQRAALQRSSLMFNTIADLVAEGQPLPYEFVRPACEPLVEAVCAGQYKDMLDGVRDHDNYTFVHSLRVAVLLSMLGHAIGLRGNDLLVLAAGGLIHDIGKMSVSQCILNKPGRLTDKEMQVMRGHVSNTATLLRNGSDVPRGVLTIAEQHHEKLDGSGYPMGLRGREINELACVASIVDIFGALTDRRPYKDATDPAHALYVMTQLREQLDQPLLRIFRSLLLDCAGNL